jgi:hypothetical protein
MLPFSFGSFKIEFGKKREIFPAPPSRVFQARRKRLRKTAPESI